MKLCIIGLGVSLLALICCGYSIMFYPRSPARSLWIKLGSLLMVFALLWTSVAVSQDVLQFVESTPPDGTEAVELEQVFQLAFDQELPDVDAIQVTGEAEDPAYTIQVDGSNQIQVETSQAPTPQLAFDLQGNTLLLQPIEPLLPGTTYNISVPAQPDLPLDEPVELTFTTQPQYTYAEDVQPLLDAACVGCHRPGATQQSSPMDTYEAVSAYIQPGEESSPLLDPQWTTRHASNFLNTTGGSTDVGGGVSFQGGRNPALGYIRRPPDENKGPADLYTLDQLGQWTPEQVELIATWIIQDDAAESLEE